MLHARALLLRNCGRFTHVQSDFGSQYTTHAFVTSEALYASLTREVTWRHAGKFVDLEEDGQKSARDDYFFCDYDVKKKPIWFTPGLFVDGQLLLLAKQHGVVDRNDFNVIDEAYPSTGGGGRPHYVPTYGRIEAVLPDHRLFTCALSLQPQELDSFAARQIFLMGKKRTMFQLVDLSDTVELTGSRDSAEMTECQPIQVKLNEIQNFREYEILAGTARYLLARGNAHESSLVASFSPGGEIPARRCVLPGFWTDKIQTWLSAG